MKRFLKNLVMFSLGLLTMLAIGIMIPATPRASTSLLFAKIEKDALLDTTRSPRIILIGGSNLSLSINSQIIQDSLKYNPVNTGISANIGLAYMLDNTLRYIRSGDIVVISPEYSQFYDELAYGREELLRTILDVAPGEIFKLRRRQFFQIVRYLPRYALSKFKPSEYTSVHSDDNEIYRRHAFNKFGDVYKHWGLSPKNFPALDRPTHYDYSVVEMLYDYKQKVEAREATLYITFPAIQETSFENQAEEIARIEKDLKEKGLALLGNPKRYKMPEEIMFDTPYHLVKSGVDFRTQLLISDIKQMLEKSRRNATVTLRLENQ